MSGVLFIILGLLLLIAGRKLYWLFVGIAGFALGWYIGMTYINSDQTWVQWLIAIGLGILGAVLARLLQKTALGVAGFIAGGYGLVFLLQTLNVKVGDVTWPFFLAGGIVGLVLILSLFEMALIVLTAWLGSALVLQGLSVKGGAETVIFFVLLIFGALVQWGTWRAEIRRG